jgi:hypothetical protein
MSKTAFRGLGEALRTSADWAGIDRAWRDSEDLMASVQRAIPAPLASLVVQIRRDDPPRGIRGSQVTVIARHAAAAAKLKLALADWPTALRQEGWGIQHLKVIAQRAQSLQPPVSTVVARKKIPQAVLQQFRALSDDLKNEALRRALARIARPR